MKMYSWRKPESVGSMLNVTEREALMIIQSLTNQLVSRNSNVGRAEFSMGGKYFSIAVEIEDVK